MAPLPEKPKKSIWWKCVPEGSHGTGTLQKRLWRAISDTVRIKDFHAYHRCISCGKYFAEWQNPDWQACHYNPYSTCRGYSKFHLDNIFGGCSYCNRGFNGAPAGVRFKEEIINRYGQERMDWLNTFQSMPLAKMDDHIVESMLLTTIKSMKDLPEQPEYYATVIARTILMV